MNTKDSHDSAAPGGDVEQRARELLANAMGKAADRIHWAGEYGIRVTLNEALRAIIAALSAPKQVDGDWDEQAYAAMRDDLESWKQRALTAEADIQRLYEEFCSINSPTHIGEPVLPSFHDIHKRGCHSPNPKYTVASAPQPVEADGREGNFVSRWSKVIRELTMRAEGRDRDIGGRIVREAWVKWALTQPNPKPSWLVPYDELSEPDKEADRQIYEACTTQQPEQPAIDLEQFRPAVEAVKRYGDRLHAEGAFLPEQYDDWMEKADRLLAIIDGAKGGIAGGEQ